MATRRQFLSRVTQASALSVLPRTGNANPGVSPVDAKTVIDAVEILRVTGPYTNVSGVNHQYQSQPIHIYPDQRPLPYKDQPNPTTSTGTLTHDFLRIRTKGGLEGLYR